MRRCIQRKADLAGWARTGLVVLLLPLAACDFTVTNPGPVQDQFLNVPTAYDGIVAGVQRGLMDAMYDADRNSTSGAREIFPGGNTNRLGVDNGPRLGIYDMTMTAGWWNASQNARWLAEDGYQRLKKIMPAAEFASSTRSATVALFAGYANRHMGELFCEGTINGGPIVPHTEFFVRAESLFTQAIAIATAAKNTNIATAALAGRASVRLGKKDYTGAAADAAGVPDAFKYQLQQFNLEQVQWNNYVDAVESTPFRTLTTWNTFIEDYFRTTGDPRVPWDKTNQLYGSALVAPWGNIPFYRQRKYVNHADPINLSTGREMRLIEAEVRLQAGDWQGALAKINALRSTPKAIVMPNVTAASVVAGAALLPWTATNVAEAGAAYKKEHMIELWLEGRRFGARRRWNVQALPGALTVWELPSTTAPVHERGAGTLLSPNSVVCMDIPLSERQLNPNIGGK